MTVIQLHGENSYNTNKPSRYYPYISLSMMFLIISDGTSPSVRMASLFGSGLIKYSVGSPRTCHDLYFQKIRSSGESNIQPSMAEKFYYCFHRLLLYTCISRANSYSSSVSTLTNSALLSYSTASCKIVVKNISP